MRSEKAWAASLCSVLSVSVGTPQSTRKSTSLKAKVVANLEYWAGALSRNKTAYYILLVEIGQASNDKLTSSSELSC
jgi:hypothetical protein